MSYYYDNNYYQYYYYYDLPRSHPVLRLSHYVQRWCANLLRCARHSTHIHPLNRLYHKMRSFALATVTRPILR